VPPDQERKTRPIAAIQIKAIPGSCVHSERRPKSGGDAGGVSTPSARGLSNKEIAQYLALSESTIKHHVHSIFGKMGLSRRSQVMHGFRDGPQPADGAQRLLA
jgi:hypothetical protein